MYSTVSRQRSIRIRVWIVFGCGVAGGRTVGSVHLCDAFLAYPFFGGGGRIFVVVPPTFRVVSILLTRCCHVYCHVRCYHCHVYCQQSCHCFDSYFDLNFDDDSSKQKDWEPNNDHESLERPRAYDTSDSTCYPPSPPLPKRHFGPYSHADNHF